jgi:ssDNA-binding Zn-finger/Zn-ribbon topoisomerase 1
VAIPDRHAQPARPRGSGVKLPPTTRCPSCGRSMRLTGTPDGRVYVCSNSSCERELGPFVDGGP